MSPVTSTVREIKLRLRIPESAAPEAGALRTLAEQTFLRGVLDALEAEIHARLGPRAIVRVRRLPLRWKVGPGDLPDRGVHARLGHELADALLADAAVPAPPVNGVVERTATAMPRPSPQASLAAFADDAHALAVALADHAEGAGARFYHPAPDIAALWQLVVDGGDEMIAAVVASLAAYEVGNEHIEPLDPPAQVRRRLAPRGARAQSTVVTQVRSEAASPHAAHAPSRSGTRSDHGAPSMDRVSPRVSPDPHADTADELLHDDPFAGEPDRDAGRERAAESPASLGPTPIVGGDVAESLDAIPTRVGGIFFLLARVAELELGEHLWCAGIAEGPALAHALGLLVPRALRDDSAFALIAGRAPEDRELAPWAVAEVIQKTHRALARWVVGRGGEPGDLVARCDVLAATLDDEPLHATIAAAVVAVVCERLGVAWSTVPAAALAVRDGMIVFNGDEIRVELAAATPDVEVRRAGLDFDPGWVPWLARRVRVVYPGEVW